MHDLAKLLRFVAAGLAVNALCEVILAVGKLARLFESWLARVLEWIAN